MNRIFFIQSNDRYIYISSSINHFYEIFLLIFFLLCFFLGFFFIDFLFCFFGKDFFNRLDFYFVLVFSVFVFKNIKIKKKKKRSVLVVNKWEKERERKKKGQERQKEKSVISNRKLPHVKGIFRLVDLFQVRSNSISSSSLPLLIGSLSRVLVDS